MIKWLEVEGLNRKFFASLEFNPDMNIITGSNGSGKTTLLKLMWYLISGQIERALYITFDRVAIGTDRFELSISSDRLGDEFQLEWSFGEPDDRESLSVYFEDAEEDCYSLNENIADTMKSSLFFPSFRRIEGGFSQTLPDSRSIRQARRSGNSIRPQIIEQSPLQEAMSQTAKEQSRGDHKFVTAFSTTDIVELLSQKETEISEKINAIYAGFSHDLAEKIPSNAITELQETTSILEQVRENLTNAGAEEQKLRNPLTSLHDFVNVIFSHEITIAKGLTLGNEKNAISSEKLSSGGKQMLSFLCYNAFSNNTTVFIDEPELSLHRDWQDTLLPLLQKQATGNQFFAATHSDLIYDQYPDQEFILDLEED